MISDKILQGLPIEDIFIFDMHGHIGNSATMFVQVKDANSIVATLDRLGVNALCASHFEALYAAPPQGNKMLLEDIKKHPGRLFGYYSPSPYYEDKELASYFEEGTGILGVKLHSSIQQCLLTDEGYAPALTLADRLGLPVLVHAWSAADVEQTKTLARRYKNAAFIMAHAGLLLAPREAAISACRECENIFVDTALSSAYEGSLEYLVSKVGVDRVLYGSDIPTFDGAVSFGRVGLSKLSENDKIKIYGENARKLFKIDNI